MESLILASCSASPRLLLSAARGRHPSSQLLPAPHAAEGDSFSLGLLAGGLSDGSVAVWNPLSMISSEGQAEDAMVARLEKHTGPVCGLEFSELTPNRLASGADEGELCIWDLKNPCEPVVYPPLKIPHKLNLLHHLQKGSSRLSSTTISSGHSTYRLFKKYLVT